MAGGKGVATVDVAEVAGGAAGSGEGWRTAPPDMPAIAAAAAAAAAPDAAIAGDCAGGKGLARDEAAAGCTLAGVPAAAWRATSFGAVGVQVPCAPSVTSRRSTRRENAVSPPRPRICACSIQFSCWTRPSCPISRLTWATSAEVQPAISEYRRTPIALSLRSISGPMPLMRFKSSATAVAPAAGRLAMAAAAAAAAAVTSGEIRVPGAAVTGAVTTAGGD